MKPVPLSVWLAALVVTIFSAHSAWQNPVLWFQCFGIVCIAASFMRVLYFLFEGQ
jgi:hypothetical protein